MIKELWFAFKFKRAVRKAKSRSEEFGLRYYVIALNGTLRVVPKRTIRELVAKHRFKKGVRVQDIERRALFVTK